MTAYEARVKRVNDAVARKEPDRVPLIPHAYLYATDAAGYTVADITYDAEKGIDAIIKFVKEFEPDDATRYYSNMGKGPVLELMEPKTVVWPGAPDGRIDKDSMHQFIEFAVLQDEEMDYFSRDFSGWLLRKGFPRVSKIMEPFATFNTSAMIVNSDVSQLASIFSRPDMRKTIETMWKINEMNQALGAQLAKGRERLAELGFPTFTGSGGGGGVPFDSYSNFFRGTLDAMADMYDNRQLIVDFCDQRLELTLENVRNSGKANQGKWVSFMLHKGMDSFMTPEQYDNLYWKYLKQVIEEVVKSGMVAYVFTEGPYNKRLDRLAEIEAKENVIYHFEEVDMAEAKRKLSGVACIAGGFPVYLLHHGKKQQVIDECKRLLDICAPGGGYIFETGSVFGKAPVENVEAMFETVKEYGKYK